jgi:hypothetical protein
MNWERSKAMVQMFFLTCLSLLCLRLLFSTLPLANQVLRHSANASFQAEQLLCQVQTQLVQPLAPTLLNTAQNAEQISTQLQPRLNTISTNVVEMSMRGRRVAIAEEEQWNSPEKVRQRTEWMNGVSVMLGNINRLLPVVEQTARDTRVHLNTAFQQVNGQVLPQTTRSLEQFSVLLANLSTLSQTLNDNSAALLQEATHATKQVSQSTQFINTVLHDARTAQVLRDLARISTNGVTVSEQMAVMSAYGADTAKQAPELARRFNEIVKGAQGWQKAFNILRLVGTVLGFFL